MTKDYPTYIPTKKWNDHHPFPTQGTLNGLLLRRESNGLGMCIIKMQGRLYIDEAKFFKWLESFRGMPVTKRKPYKKRKTNGI